MGQGEARSMAIAQFPSLSYLNASLVSTNERKEAERRYVSMVTRLLQSTSLEPDEATRESNRQSLLAKHPQYDTLKDEHRDVIAAASNSTAGGASGSGGSTLSATVANLMVRSMAASSCSMEPLVRRLPGSLTVGRLKALCSRYFGLDTDLISLHYRTKADAFPIELDGDDNTLDYYGVSDGGEMLMNEVDLRSGRDSLNGKSDDGGDDIDTFESKVKEQERDLIARQELQRHMESGGR
uniref:Ubiquitin-like domain-containing protein n=1 Tax=Craspedostauros australis TaxID=1486917 RepID=A0A7R9WYB4_9STRA